MAGRSSGCAPARDWTFEEELALLRHFARARTRARLPILSGRTKHAVRMHAYEMRRAGRLHRLSFGVLEADLPY